MRCVFRFLEAVLERNRGKTFYLTEKLDGTSFTAFLKDTRTPVRVAATSGWTTPIRRSLLVRVAVELGLEEKLRATGREAGYSTGDSGRGDCQSISRRTSTHSRRSLCECSTFSISGSRIALLADHSAMFGSDLRDRVGRRAANFGTLVLNHMVDDLIALSEGTSLLNPQAQREAELFCVRSLRSTIPISAGG